MKEYYKIKSEALVSIADAIRGKKDTTAVFTPEQMAVEIAGIASCDDLPNAEGATFGTGDGSNGERLIEWTEGNSCNQWEKGTIGWEFTVNETFGVVGFRGMVAQAGTYTFKIREQYEESAVAELQVNFEETYTWCEFKLPNTVNLLAGKTFAFTLYGNKMSYVGTGTSYTMNSKVTENNKVYVSGADAYPTTTIQARPTINMLMGAVISESTPNEYKIQTQTLSDIADEVRRIGGVSGNITTAQMLTLLKSVNA